MKILFFLGSPNPFPGAAWTRIGFFANYFRNKGYKVYVAGIFSPYSLSNAGLMYWKGIKIYNICPTFWMENTFSLLFNILSSLIILPLLLIFLRPDLTIISVPTGEPAVGAYIASRLVGAKVIFDIRDEWEDYIISKISSNIYGTVYRLFKTLMSSIYAKSDLVVVVTPNIIRSILSRGVKGVKLLPNGADVSIFRPYEKASTRKKLGLKKDDFILVYSGGVGGYYRLDVVVEAMARLDSMIRGKIRLLIMGSGDMFQLVVRLAEELGLKDNIVYLGVKNDKEELAQILSAGDVGIVPYDDNPLWKNSVPAKFYEYCACGIPVLATVYDDSLLAKLIKENKIGLTVPPMDEEKLAEAVRLMYEHRSYGEEAGKRARMLIEERFDRNKIAEEFLNLIKPLLSRK